MCNHGSRLPNTGTWIEGAGERENSSLNVAISGDQPINQDGIESMNRRVRSLAHEVPLVTASRDGCLKECSGRWKLNEIDGNGTFPHKKPLRFVIPTNYIQYFEVHWLQYTATKPNMELKRAETSSAWKGKKRSLFLRR